MTRLAWAALLSAAMATGALAVSVGEIARKCGDDAKAYCDGVGYGDPMTECLAEHRSKLAPQCKVIVDRIRNGENVSLF